MSRNIFLFISSQVISDIGDWIDRIAVLTLVYNINNSSVDMSFLSIMMLMPSLIFGVFAGKIVDIYNKKRILILGDFLRAILVFLIPFFKEYVFIIIFIVSTISIFYDTAKSSILPELVKKDRLRQVNSLSSSYSSLMMVLGPSISGFIISEFDIKYCFYIDSLTFLLSMIMIFLIKLYKYGSKKDVELYQTDKISFIEGLKYIKGNRIIFNTLAINTIVGLAAGMLNGLLIMYVYKFLKTDSQGYGAILTFKGLAMILTSLVLYKYLKNVPVDVIFKLGLIGLGISTTVFPLNTFFGLAILIQFFNGIFNALYSISRTTIIQENCDNQYLGRTFSMNTMLTNITSIISLAFGGVAAEFFGVRAVLIIGGLIVLISGFIARNKIYLELTP
ncbi:MFS transporter [Thermoanaerobacterium thermosaccharolyticum]|uniref:Arabinose efflux permease family protein n=1 Tax=Thermoanaerobacterium thermosaccharolyticum M0795 TaxID=698948 RepID=L0IIU2_THETR|nr:MFS transporter [Thermoanaerobacterium thermosaccharolyticum]AGB18763.1 arabinose efflux permease family protein [Thermoanaerobacterium thermosaccharolyticum M0795]